MSGSANLGHRLEEYVSELVRTGRFNSRSDVLREGVRMVEEREKRLAALDAALAEGLADVEAGRVISIDEAFERVRLALDTEGEEGPSQ